MEKTKKWNNTSLFLHIVEILKEKSLLRDFLDYAVAEKYQVSDIETEEIECNFDLRYGGSEGVYLNVYLSGRITKADSDFRKIPLGVFKTLDSSDEGVYKMAKLQADFMIQFTRYANSHLDEFTWYGADVKLVSDDNCDPKLSIGYMTCPTLKRAFEKAVEYNEKNVIFDKHAIVRDNFTRQYFTATGQPIPEKK